MKLCFFCFVFFKCIQTVLLSSYHISQNMCHVTFKDLLDLSTTTTHLKHQSRLCIITLHYFETEIKTHFFIINFANVLKRKEMFSSTSVRPQAYTQYVSNTRSVYSVCSMYSSMCRSVEVYMEYFLISFTVFSIVVFSYYCPF